MKYIITILLTIGSAVNLYSQHRLSGIIRDAGKETIGGAVVTIEQKGIAAKKVISDSMGRYEVPDISSGSAIIEVRALGFELKRSTVVIKDTLVYDIYLQPVSGQLQAVEVVGRFAKKYNSDYSFSATRTATANKDVPQSIGTVTKELMTDRQAFQLADAVKVIPGVIPSSFYNQYAIRGISQNEEGQIINGMRTRQYYFLQPLTANIERVEVLKGPGSAGFASVDPGGSINMVTKKPLPVRQHEVSFTAGSFSTLRGSLDFTGPVTSDKKLLYRLNAAYQQARSFRDLVRNNALLISPSLSYLPNEKTAVNVEMIFSDMTGNLDRGQPIFGAVAGHTDLKSTPVTLNLGAASDYFKSKELVLMASLSHRFNEVLSFNTNYMKQTWQEDLREHRTTNAYATDINGQQVTSLVGMQFVQRQQHWSVDNLNTFLSAKGKTGSVQHRVLLGYDLSSWEKLKGGGQNSARGYLLKDGTVAGAFSPANAANYQTITYNNQLLPKPNVNYFDLNNPSYAIRNADDYNLNIRLAIPPALTTTHALYIQEQLYWNRFILLIGLRHDWFKDITNYKAPRELSFNNNKLLPRVGLTYKVSEAVNVYGTYLEGYQPQSNTVTLLPNTGTYFWTDQSAARFKPLVSNLKEVGTKATLIHGKLNLNAAFYEINQQNLLMNANLPEFPDSMVTRGAERSRGFEADLTGYLFRQLQVYASYSYIDAKIVRDNNPALIGARKQNTPMHSANLWTRYNCSQLSGLRGVGVGAGLQYNGSRIPWFDRSFVTPAYLLLDMALYYQPAMGHMMVALNVNNVFDKTYWVGAQSYQRLFPGTPRNIMLTATYNF